jgi:ABC-type polysaccharide/polyol phosphate export permease
VRKARFPRETIPASVVTVHLVTFLALLALLSPITIAIRGTIEAALLLLPFILACLFAFVLGFALAVSILHAYFRDVAPILSAALLPWFFVSPIFFRPERITDEPAARFVLELAYIVIAAGLALLVGRTLFRRLQGELAVVV